LGTRVDTALGIARAGGQSAALVLKKRRSNAQPTFYANITVAGAQRRFVLHARAQPDAQGSNQPGLVFDRTTNIDGVPDGYRAMNEPRSHQSDDRVLSISRVRARRTADRLTTQSLTVTCIPTEHPWLGSDAMRASPVRDRVVQSTLGNAQLVR
jgi:hypothetical protein